MKMINLRYARYSDADLLLRWRNDPDTRKASINTKKVSKKEHMKWLMKSFDDDKRRIYIACENGVPVGVVRSDIIYELSWTVAPEARGRGVGKEMVKLLAQRLNTPIIARAKEGNIASRKIAKYAGIDTLLAE